MTWQPKVIWAPVVITPRVAAYLKASVAAKPKPLMAACGWRHVGDVLMWGNR